MARRRPESRRDGEVEKTQPLTLRTVDARLKQHSQPVREVYEGWCALYGTNKENREALFDILSSLVRRFGDQRVWMFAVTGDPYWHELSFREFQQVIDTLIRETDRFEMYNSEGEAQKIQARRYGETAAIELMRIFLSLKTADRQAERARYIRELLVKEGPDFVRAFVEVTEGISNQYELYQGVEELLRLREKELARQYLQACKRWGCTALEAVTLVARVVYMYEEKGAEACSLYLNAPVKPSTFQTVH